MSNAASQASAFYREVAASGRVFTVVSDEDLVVFPVHGREVVPFWSSRARTERVRSIHPKYRRFTCDELSLEHFLTTTLPDLEREGVLVGANWSGRRLIGYDLAVPDLIANLNLRMQKGAGG